MKSALINKLKVQGKIVKNAVAYVEDKTLFEVNQKLECYLKGNVEIPFLQD